MPAPTTHARQQIREALATALTGLTTTSTRVYQSRLHTLRDGNLPCLLINTDSEEIVSATMNSPGLLERALTVVVRCITKATSDLDDALDTMAKEVETALGVSTLSGLVENILLQSISVDMDDAMEKPVGVLSLTYQISYFTASNAPTVTL